MHSVTKSNSGSSTENLDLGITKYAQVQKKELVDKFMPYIICV